MKFDIRYTDYFIEYAKYFGRALRLLKSMYSMTNSGNFFSDELTEWLLEACFIPSQCQMSIWMDLKLLFYVMLMTVYIGMQMKILENGVWIL